MTATTASIDFDQFTLTADQQAALDAFQLFLVDPTETVFVLSGYSGCGKSTWVRTMLDRLPGFLKTVRLINPSQREYEPTLTATTNKAAENLGRITGYPVATIHSQLGLRVQTDYRTGITTLIPKNQEKQEGLLLVIDEASFIDPPMLKLIFQRTEKCKIVFIGDPAQLTQVKAMGTPVFDAGFNGAALTQVVRQAEGNPIVDLSTKFRHAVNTGEFFAFKPDGHHIRHMDRDTFNKAIEQEFTRPEWRFDDSKILAWTNKCVIGYNQYVSNLAKGNPHFQEGDYAVCNSFVQAGKISLKTDQMVQITDISDEQEKHGVMGRTYTIDHIVCCFMPNSLELRNKALKEAKSNEQFQIVADIEERWIDLRAAFSCTINKAQGSTFGSVFIDLDDIRRCNSGDQIARMLYVGVSRARAHVFLTGDLA